MSDHHYPTTTTSVKMQRCELIARCSGGRGSGSSRLWWRWWQCICHFGVKAGAQDRKVWRMSLGLFCDFLRVSDSFWMNERWLPVWWNGVVENNYIRTTKTPSVERRWLVKIPIFYKITTSPPFQNFSNRKSPQVGATLVKTHFQAMGGILRGTRRLCIMVGVQTELWNIEHLSWRKISFEGFARNNVQCLCKLHFETLFLGHHHFPCVSLEEVCILFWWFI